MASQLWSALGWAEKGLVSLGMGNKLPVWTGPCSAAVDWWLGIMGLLGVVSWTVPNTGYWAQRLSQMINCP